MYKIIKHECYKIFHRNLSICKSYFWIIRTLILYPRKTTTVISFYADYSADLRYEKSAISLSKKLKRWRIPFLIEKIDDKGGYRKNTLLKPLFILEKIQKLKQNVIWIDCDTNPSTPEAIFRVACDQNKFCAISDSGDFSKMQSWLLKFEYHTLSISLINSWAQYCNLALEKDIPELDHNALKWAILPYFQNKINIGYVMVNSRKSGFEISASKDDTIQIIQARANSISNVIREKLMDEIMKNNID
jgi:hypothetical protein